MKNKNNKNNNWLICLLKVFKYFLRFLLKFDRRQTHLVSNSIFLYQPIYSGECPAVKIYCPQRCKLDHQIFAQQGDQVQPQQRLYEKHPPQCIFAVFPVGSTIHIRKYQFHPSTSHHRDQLPLAPSNCLLLALLEEVRNGGDQSNRLR